MPNKTDRYSIYEERGDLLERKAISEKYLTGWYLQTQLDEINEQIRIIENVTPQAQNYYFESLDTASASTPEDEVGKWLDNLTPDELDFVNFVTSNEADANDWMQQANELRINVRL